MNDWAIRIGLAVIAGLTYLAGAIPDTMHANDLSTLPFRTWLLFAINVLTGVFSPSLVKSAASAVGGKKK